MQAKTIEFFRLAHRVEVEDDTIDKYEEEQSFDYNYDPEDYKIQYENIGSVTQSGKNDTQSREETKRENLSEEKIDTTYNDNFLDFQLEIEKQKFSPKKSLLPSLLSKKINSRRTQITVYLFNTPRKLTFQRAELKKLLEAQQHQSAKDKTGYTVSNLILVLVKSFCKLFLNFQPEDINTDSFLLKLANLENIQDQLLDSIDPNQSVALLFGAGNLVMVRRKRANERLAKQQRTISVQKKDVQALQIIVPSGRQLIQYIQKTKTIKDLREKSLMLGQLSRIIIVEYTSFRICDSHEKIYDLKENVLQVFTLKKHSYQDRPMKGNFQREIPKLNAVPQPLGIQNPRITAFNLFMEALHKTKDHVFIGNQNKNHIIKEKEEMQGRYQKKLQILDPIFYNCGNTYLIIEGTKIIEKHIGGILLPIRNLGVEINSNANQRDTSFDDYASKTTIKRQRSIHNLVAISSEFSSVKLKFKDKNGVEIVKYELKDKESKDLLLRQLLRLERMYNKNFSKIQ